MSDAAMLRLVRTVERELRRHERQGPSAVEVRAAMKRRGLKHCFYPGYGYRWCRGRRVRDDREVEQIGRIVAMHEQGQPLYRIAVTFMYERVKTRAGKEWSYDRVCRAYWAYWAAVRGEVPGVSVADICLSCALKLASSSLACTVSFHVPQTRASFQYPFPGRIDPAL